MSRSRAILRSACGWTGFAIAAVAAAAPARAQYDERWRVTPGVTQKDHYFGGALDADDGWMVAGAIGDNMAGSWAGAAFVFQFDPSVNEWKEIQQLLSSKPADFAMFGSDVVVDEDVIAVSAPSEDNKNGAGAGAVYVFRFDPATGLYAEEARLLASDGNRYQGFGDAIALDGDLLAIGAPDDDTNGTSAGAVYVFRRDATTGDWVEETKLLDPNGWSYDVLGMAVALDDTRIAAGSPHKDRGDYDEPGSVSVWSFDGTSWAYEGELVGESTTYDAFGESVAVDGDLIAAGASWADEATYAGEVYLYRYVGGVWTEEEELYSVNDDIYDGFGEHLDLEGDLIVVGAQYTDLNGKLWAGVAYTFRNGRKGWLLDETLSESDPTMFGYFGGDIAISEDHVFVGSTYKKLNGLRDAGAAYVYGAREMNLDVTPAAPAPGGNVNFDVHSGEQRTPLFVGIVEIDGVPFLQPVLSRTFHHSHHHVTDFISPNPPLGIEVGLQAYGIGVLGNVVASEVAYVDL